MRLSSLLLLGSLLLAGEAQAQFANRSLGVAAGYMNFNLKDLNWGVPVGLEGSVYVENGFDVVFHGYALVLTDNIYGRQFIGFYGSGGVRYLFSQESLRPYVGMELGYFQAFGRPDNDNINRVGLSPTLGLDYFVSDNTSLGIRGEFTAYWMLNQQVATSFGGHFMVATWF